MPPLIILEEIYAMSSGDKSDAEPISTDILEDISDSTQSLTSINRRKEHYNIFDHIKQSNE